MMCASANNVSYEALNNEDWVSLKNMVLCMFSAINFMDLLRASEHSERSELFRNKI